MSVLTVVQARMGSSRLPGKSLVSFDGATLLDRVYGLAEEIGHPVAVTIPETDGLLRDYIRGHGWRTFLRPEHDVLAGFGEAALHADHVVRVTADCPFLDPWAARQTIRQHLSRTVAMTWDGAEGRGVQVFRSEALILADKEAAEAHEREHVDPWVRQHLPTDRVKFSVDTLEELETARRRING